MLVCQFRHFPLSLKSSLMLTKSQEKLNGWLAKILVNRIQGLFSNTIAFYQACLKPLAHTTYVRLSDTALNPESFTYALQSGIIGGDASLN